jgi:outer membrane protein OmpA-like peptidoglycan-associated protein
MTRGQALALACVAGAVAFACGPRRVVTPAVSQPDLVVLLSEPETATVGRASVSNQFGTTNLDGDRAATHITAGQAPTPATILDASEVSGIFGETLASLPMPAQSFVLYFRVESDELTDASRLLLPEVMRAVTARVAPDFVVVGHTDTMGNAKFNVVLGMTRANVVRSLLISAGMDASLIEVASHGEADPLIRTPDETPEPRNRRVEIAVR